MKRKINKKNWFCLVGDVLVTFVFLFVFFAAFNKSITSEQIIGSLVYSCTYVLLTVIVFFFCGIYDMLVHNFGLTDALKLAFIVFCIEITGLFPIIFISEEYLPKVSIVIWFFVVISLVAILPSLRLVSRVIKLLNVHFKKSSKYKTILIGAGDAAKIVIDESRSNPRLNRKIVALVDDDYNKINTTYAGIPVFGPISEIKKYVDKYAANEVVIAINNLSNLRLREILEIVENLPVRIKRMPILSEMAAPNSKNIIDVDLNELLCRDPIVLDNHEVTEMVKDKCVLVTGAGGSIGSELVRQIYKCKPKTLILFDIYENATYDIQMELNTKIRKDKCSNIHLVTLIGSTYNSIRVEQIFKKYKPNYVYHAAAYKHVPLMEDSPQEAIRTNVIGTYNIAKMANKYGALKMVLVSTDKAVRPTNVMGATKRFAEMIIQHFSSHSEGTKYAAVRFGNVLGSNGSVVPLFKKQIESGGPVTITDRNIIRYFMTIPEAVSLILQCGLFAEGGEIFILDMGKPIKIVDLAEKLIRQAGLVPNQDIKIVETGLRPGEKLYEELLVNKAVQKRTSNEKIFVESAELTNISLESMIANIGEVFEYDDNAKIKNILSSIIHSYTPNEK